MGYNFDFSCSEFERSSFNNFCLPFYPDIIQYTSENSLVYFNANTNMSLSVSPLLFVCYVLFLAKDVRYVFLRFIEVKNVVRFPTKKRKKK